MSKNMGSKVKRKRNRKLKRIFTPYNIAIVICFIIIVFSLLKLIPSNKNENKEEVKQAQIKETNEPTEKIPVKVVETSTKEGETISEKDAKKLAIKQFKQLGEKGLNEKDLEVVKVLRANDEYYYISSPKNTLEIKLVGGNITRVNSIPVENL